MSIESSKGCLGKQVQSRRLLQLSQIGIFMGDGIVLQIVSCRRLKIGVLSESFWQADFQSAAG
jgi:hypothetical protein